MAKSPFLTRKQKAICLGNLTVYQMSFPTHSFSWSSFNVVEYHQEYAYLRWYKLKYLYWLVFVFFVEMTLWILKCKLIYSKARNGSCYDQFSKYIYFFIYRGKLKKVFTIFLQIRCGYTLWAVTLLLVRLKKNQLLTGNWRLHNATKYCLNILRC